MTTRGQPASASWVLSSQLPACTNMPSVFYLFVCFVFAVGSGDGIQFLMLVWQALQPEPLFLVKSVCPSSPASCPSPRGRPQSFYSLPCQECSQRANNGRFTLRDLLMVPMQRVLKYHLLLQVPAQGWVPWVWLGTALVSILLLRQKHTDKSNYKGESMRLGS